MEIGSLLVLALGAALFLEGLPYFVSPRAVRRMLAAVGSMGDALLRTMGLAMMVAGLLMAYLATR